MDTATSTRPRFRTDLVAQPIEDKGQVFVDVTDPDSGTTFRFYEIEYSVACAMDGARDLPALRAWARDEIGVEPTDEELTTVIATLDELGYLDHSPASAGRAAAVPGGASAPGQEDVELGKAGRSPERGERTPPPAEDVELGHAGAGSPAHAAVPATSAPGAAAEESFQGLMDEDPAAEFSRVGTTPFARTSKLPIQAGEGDEAAPAKPAAKQDSASSLREGAHRTDDEDGPTNIPPPASQFDEDEVSVDLSDHLSIGTADVKEAVRQSRVMQVPDTSEAEEPAKTSAPAAEAPAAKAPRAASKSEELAAVAKPAQTPAASESEGSGLRVALIALLAIVVLGGVGYYAYTQGLIGGADEAAEPADAASEAEVVPPTAVLSAEEVEPAFLEAEESGEVVWLAEPETPVEEGDELVRFAGYDEAAEALEFQIGQEAQLQDRLDQATAEDNRRQMRQLESQVEEAQASVAEAEAELARFRTLAPQDGIFEAEIEEGDELEAGDAIGVIAAEPRAIGVFEVDDASDYSEGQAVTLASEGAGEVASCEVIAVDASSVTVACPPGSPFGAGATVALQ